RSEVRAAWRRHREYRRCRSARRGGFLTACSHQRSTTYAAWSEGYGSSSVGIRVIDVEVIKLASRAVALELVRLHVLEASAFEQLGKLLVVLWPHLLLDAVGAQALDLAAYEQLGLVDGVAERIASI